MYLMQKCIESIHLTCKTGDYEIVVVDNASTDGVREWLCEQDDIKTILLDENVGFPMACNIGVEYAEPENDIFLLNNDTRMCQKSLENMQAVLYAKNEIGAVGAVSNYAGNDQEIKVEFSTPNAYVEYGNKYNVEHLHFAERRVRLSAFAMLIKRDAWNTSGGFDEAFTPGYFDDDDLSMKIARAGYELAVARNSFIYHVGSQSFAKKEGVESLLLSHRNLFINKYGFDVLEFFEPDYEILQGLPQDRNVAFNLLIVGSGLGAETFLVNSIYPNANVIGIENDANVNEIANKNSISISSFGELEKLISNPIFQYVYVTERGKKLISDSTDSFAKMCLPGCKILNLDLEKLSFDKVKLVIWDLDETFWSGTLSEGEIVPIYECIETVKNLTDAGIINSISSKNDSDKALGELSQIGLNEYFVFNDINWNSKGAQIKNKLSLMHLRSENVLFIDDNPHNREEVTFENQGLMACGIEAIHALYQYSLTVERKDTEHKRLAEYKVLENKEAERTSFSNSEDFLKQSEIAIELDDKCERRIDRVYELIQRTNQLNYTKVRLGLEETEKLLRDSDVTSALIKVKDKYGDYGYAGFYAYRLSTKRLEHFVFSCRIIGMGIPQYIYRMLGTPLIDVINPVAENIESEGECDWITLESGAFTNEERKKENKGRKIKVLLKGPCDMSAIESYLSGGDITTEFNHVNEAGFISASMNHSMHIWESANLPQEKIDAIVNEVPFITKDDFETSIFKEKYDVICYSLLQDCHAGLYKRKDRDEFIAFGGRNFDLTDSENWDGYLSGTIQNHLFDFDKNILKKFSDAWEFVGKTPLEILLRNLDYIYENAPGNPNIVLLLGSERKFENNTPEYEGFEEWHKTVNEAVYKFAEDRERIKIVDVNRFILSQADYADSINHYSRNVYYDLTTEIVKIINNKVERS